MGQTHRGLKGQCDSCGPALQQRLRQVPRGDPERRETRIGFGRDPTQGGVWESLTRAMVMFSSVPMAVWALAMGATDRFLIMVTWSTWPQSLAWMTEPVPFLLCH